LLSLAIVSIAVPEWNLAFTLAVVANVLLIRASGSVPLLMFAAFVVSVVADVASPLTSPDAIVTAPVRPATLVTLADSVPLLTLKPEPTITPPLISVVASGSV